MRIPAASLVAVLVLVGAAAPRIAGGEEAGSAAAGAHRADRLDGSKDGDGLAGEYAFAGGEDERQALERAIDAVVSDMSLLVRGLARHRLRGANRVPARLAIARRGDEVIVSLDERRYAARPGGPPVHVIGVTGEELVLRLTLAEGGLAQRFTGARGERHNLLVRMPDGRLRLRVRVTSPRLPRPLAYELTFASTSRVAR